MPGAFAGEITLNRQAERAGMSGGTLPTVTFDTASDMTLRRVSKAFRRFAGEWLSARALL